MSDIYASYDAAIAKIAELEATIEELTGDAHDANKWILRSVYKSSERERKRLVARVEELEAENAKLHQSAYMACEEPCGSCGACLYADEVHKRAEGDDE